MSDEIDALKARMKKAIEDAFDESVKNRVEALFVNALSYNARTVEAEFEKGLGQLAELRCDFLKIVDEFEPKISA